MNRKLFTSVALLSLLLFVVTMVLWMRSYVRLDEVKRFMSYYGEEGTADRSVVSALGVIYAYKLSVGTVDASPPPVIWVWKSHPTDDPLRQSSNIPLPGYLDKHIQIGGYGVAYSADEFGITHAELRIAYWPFAVFFSVLPAFWIWSWIGRRGRIGPHCDKCGYNLTNNTSGVCPECGTAVAEKPA